MKVVVDANHCEGHARCWQICPEVFALDDEGHSYVIVDEVPGAMEERARHAVDNCPERAISIN
jgi:ferredoxin